MKHLIFILLLTLFADNISFSQWYWGWSVPQGEFPEYVVIADTFSAYVVTETFYGDTTYIYRLSSSSGWKKLPMAGFMYGQRTTCIAAHDSDLVWAGTDNGNIYFTTNGGMNWNLQVSTGGSGFINDIRFSDTDPNAGYANSDPPGGIGTPFKIFKTTNGGFNWTVYSVSSNTEHVGASKSSWVTDANHYWMGLYCQWTSYCANTSLILFTSDGGGYWQIAAIPNSSHFVMNIVFQSDNTYGLSTPWDVLPVDIYRSTNGGHSWYLNNVTSHTQPIMTLDWAEGTSNWYYCASDDGTPVYKSTNNGQSWFPMETTIYPDEQIVSLDVKRLGGAVFGYAITFDGSILQLFGDTISSIGVNHQGEEIPNQFSLSQNYPNPFNPVTKIKFDIPPSKGARGMITTLVIYDILGREVAVLVNEQLSPGTYEVKWDASAYPSGVYFYQLSINNEQLATKKMILIK